ncbi:Type VI secretion-like protein VasL [Vibrio cholerae]|nr:Type VI secretion-like protein VasL [Vibrio cholerae]
MSNVIFIDNVCYRLTNDSEEKSTVNNWPVTKEWIF